MTRNFFQKNLVPRFIVRIGQTDIDSNMLKYVGGKARPLIKLGSKGMCVPHGFVITTQAYNLFLKTNHLIKRIAEFQRTNSKNMARKVAEDIKLSILEGKIPEALITEIDFHTKQSGARRYAVRSSANVEDTEKKSWAGEFESFLNIPPAEVMLTIKKCWASLFNDRVIDYAEKVSQVYAMKMAVIVQESINCDVSGVCFTRNPLEEDDDNIFIEAVFGLGELLMQGEANPDRYEVERGSNIILRVNVEQQDKTYKVLKNGGTKLISIKKTFEQKLHGKKITELAKIAQKVEKIHGKGRDIEWCYKDRQIYVLQSRPIPSERKK